MCSRLSDPEAPDRSFLQMCVVIALLFKLCDSHCTLTSFSACLCPLRSDGMNCVDSGWLTCQTEIRLRLHYSKAPPVSITKRKFKKSRFR